MALEWDDARSGEIKPSVVALHSNEGYHWKCCKCGHQGMTSPNNRAKGRGCPACKRLHPTKNGKKAAVDYFVDYTRNVWWECEQGHGFRASVRSMATGWRSKVCDP